MKPPVLLLLVTLLFPALAFGWGGPLGGPSLSYQSSIGAKQEEKANKALDYMRNTLTYLEGNFINQFTFQRFNGDSEQVVHFIHLLEEAGLWKVHVQFRDFEETVSAFSLDQNSSQNYLRLIINSSRNDFSLKDFAAFLPPPRLPLLNQIQQRPLGIE